MKEIDTNDNNNNNQLKCFSCESVPDLAFFYCYKCKYALCQSCCHTNVCNSYQKI